MEKTTQELLADLGIKAKNESICTGRDWVTSLGTETVEVFTPVSAKS